ncbi:hypothetical protein Mesop_2829 [Mesorhizobium opportunistum WSM2075]|uniref:Uncharacterized protein n=1 Tax=Mesorhizobium opportunistum (strain LMG 24607 / HAMBI 3007 / WSM2075) TaxID=536019 RepID=F7Y4G7_MESOW|nr:hypothetical protein Mesop_2829 [Mesorhizobium opportunistum WSM2075]
MPQRRDKVKSGQHPILEVWLQSFDFGVACFVTRIARLLAGLAETNSCGSTFNALAKISTVSSVALRRPASTLLI